MESTPMIQDISVAVILLTVLVVSLEAGFRAGLCAIKDADPRASGQVGAIQGAVLGLLGLLLAFSFSAASERFLERQDLIVTQANAIGTAYLRADLLEGPQKAELRAALQRHTEYLIELSGQLRHGLSSAMLAEIGLQQHRIWAAALEGVQVRPAAIVVVIPAVNDVFDLLSTRMAATKKQLPMPVLILLIACSALAVGVIGYGSGLAGRRRAPLTLSLALLIAAALWITVDLDHPRAGLLQLSDEPLKQLKFEPSR